MLDFDYSKNVRLKELALTVNNNPEDVEAWKELLEATINQDGRLNRGSDPAEIAGTRAAFNQFLTLYPLSQETWIQYAQLEFRLAGTEAAEYVYERAVGGCASSVEIWTKYCEHLSTTSHNTRAIRELLERALQSAGHDFYADPIWDACLTYERQHGSLAGLLEAYKQVINIPLFHYARYFNDFRAIAVQAPLEALEPAEAIADLQATVQKELGQADPTDLMAALRNKVDQRYWDNFQRLQEEVNNRWQWEQHVGKDGGSKLDESTRVSMWKDYLDYEENKGDYIAVRALYERCLLFNSTQTQFWYRYVRWLTARPDKEEETRNVYRRVSSIFAPIYDPAIRLSWARFEEAFARPSVAAEIYEAVLDELPDDLSTHASLTMLCRRQQGLDAAIQSLDTRADRAKILPNTRGALVVEKAKLLWRETSDAHAARQAFVQNQKALTDVATFWYGWLSFEIDQPVRREKTHVPDRARSIYQTMQQMANLSSSELQGLSTLYMQYLDERGDSSSIAELVELDAYVNGPTSLRSTPGATNAPTVVNGQGG